MEKEEKERSYPSYVYPPGGYPVIYEEDEIDLLELWDTIWRNKLIIFLLTFIITFISAVISLRMENIYKSEATILPITEKGASQPSLLSRLGGLASMVGITPFEGKDAAQIIVLLKSKSFKREVIEKYNLLPVILYKEWDEKKKIWKRKEEGVLSRILEKIKFFQSKKIKNREEILPEEEKRLIKAVKVFSDIMKVEQDKKSPVIRISVEYKDPKMAAKILSYSIEDLKKKIVKDTIDIAQKKIKLLKKQLLETSDPIIQQKLYELIAKESEKIVMAKVSEDFAFKIIDPPNIPLYKFKPKRKLIVMVAFVSGLFLSIFLVFFKEFLRKAREKKNKEG